MSATTSDYLTKWTYPYDGKRESLNVGSKRAEVGSEETWQHVDSLVDEVHGRSPGSRLLVHGGGRVDEVRNVGDVWQREGGEKSTFEGFCWKG